MLHVPSLGAPRKGSLVSAAYDPELGGFVPIEITRGGTVIRHPRWETQGADVVISYALLHGAAVNAAHVRMALQEQGG